jgi:hypothetical protein
LIGIRERAFVTATDICEADLEILERFRVPAAELPNAPGYFTNFIGVETSQEVFPDAKPRSGCVVAELPIPDDKLHGGAHEYVALLQAVERRREAGEITAVEIGAGWGPWITAVGVVCARLGFRRIELVGVEADPYRFELMRQHLTHNLGKYSEAERPEIICRMLCAAVWPESTQLYFPVIDPSRDHGAAATAEIQETDYRGMAIPHRAVTGLTLETICRPLDKIDYMHWDIQGAELDVAFSCHAYLSAHVKSLFIGTHSPRMEGGLIQLFHKMQWDLAHYKPCVFQYDRAKPSVEGMVVEDGELVFINPQM